MFEDPFQGQRLQVLRVTRKLHPNQERKDKCWRIYFNYAFNSKPGNWGLTFQQLDLIGTCWGIRCRFLITYMSTKYSPDHCSSVVHHYQAARVLSLSWKPLKLKNRKRRTLHAKIRTILQQVCQSGFLDVESCMLSCT